MTVKAVLVLLTGLLLAGSAEAQPVPGGLPALAARVTALEQATRTLQSQVIRLQGQLETPQGQVNTLQSRVTTLENGTRSSRSALDDEIANRQEGDIVLRAAIEQETLARTAADAAIIANSRAFSTYNVEANLVEGARATVGTIGPLPAGSYAVVATATVFNLDHNAGWDCRLSRADTGAVIGRTAEGTTSVSFTESALGGTHVTNVTIPALVILPDNGTLHMTCATGEAGSSVFDIQIVARSVGVATIACGDVLACD
jgi:hypothetical protein